MSEETPQDASSHSVLDIFRPDQNSLITALTVAIQSKNFRNIFILIFLGAPVNDQIKEFAQQEGVLEHLEAAINAAREPEEPSSTFSY